MKITHQVGVLLLGLMTLSGCSKQTPFDQAQVATIDHDVVELERLIDLNPSVISEGSGFDGSTLLHAALVNSPSFECAKLLIEKGADVNKSDVTGEYPIHIICRFNGNTNCLALLLSHGADPTVKWRKKKTPIELAQERGYTEAIEMLKKAEKTN